VLEAGEKSRAEGHVILLQAHMSSLRYHPLLAAFFGINQCCHHLPLGRK
jgi:hypothetical protein